MSGKNRRMSAKNVQFSDEDDDFQDEEMKRARLFRTTLRGELSSFMNLRKVRRRRKQATSNEYLGAGRKERLQH